MPSKPLISPVFYIDRFSSDATSMRRYFASCFQDPLNTHSKRFVWDYWNVPDQFRLIRTPAWEYFPDALYRSFHERLVLWGRKILGCHDVSPPWLSYYVEGCFQALHTDRPHGPWAFVHSLSPRRQIFSGGETRVLVNGKKTFKTVSPKFNRLVIFDPSLKHGVSKVY